MPKFAANLTMLFNEVSFLDRFEAAAQAGFKGVEYLFPYAFDKNELAARLDRHGLVQVLHNLPAGNWEGGERGIACHPDRVGETSTAGRRHGIKPAARRGVLGGCTTRQPLLDHDAAAFRREIGYGGG